MCCKCNKTEKKMDFSKIELFDGISATSCRDMMVCFGAEFDNFRAGELICDYSDNPRRRVGIMRSGSASMIRTDESGNETLLEEIGGGDIFGEVLCFGDASDLVRLVCDEDCEVVFLKYDQITKRCEKACEHHSRLVSNLFALMAKKTLALGERIQLLSRRTTREKLMYYFRLESARRGCEFTLPMSHTRLAEYLCVDRSAMVRELKKLSDDGLVALDGKKVRLKVED